MIMKAFGRFKGGRFIFIEYDLGIGNMLTPIYSLLFDMAIKEALCRKKSEGRGIVENVRDANVVEDWDITRLGIGQAIIGLPGKEPFLFQFKKA